MERARSTWTDERLDDLGRRVENGFQSVDADLRSINERMDEGFRAVNARMDKGFRALDARIENQGTRIDSLQRTMIQVGGGLMAGMLGMIVTFIATLG